MLFFRPLHVNLGPLTPWGRAVGNRERLRACLRDHLRAARGLPEGGGLLAGIARGAPDLPEDEIIAEALALLLFGHDTGAAALAWAVAHIWRRPEILERVRQESRSAWRSAGCCVPESHPYLEACLKESLRLTPVVVHLTRVAARDTRVGGQAVAAGTRVFPCAYLAQRDPEVFPEPAAFRPERFLDGQTYEGSWFPFGLGARTCIGNRFALRQMLLTAATLARCEGFELAAGWQPRAVRQLVLVVPKGGTPMRSTLPRASPSVLVVTGGWLTGQEGSLVEVARKMWAQQRSAEDPWLDLAVKAVLAEPVLAARLERLGLPFRDRRLRDTVKSVLADRTNVETPSLTEVVLTTLLDRAGLPYERMELGDLVTRPDAAERKLAAASCVFLFSTYLHDLSELEPAVRRLKRQHNRVVVGGALAGILHGIWDGMPEVDVLAVGYGERLVGSLAAWIRSGYQTLEPPPGGRLVRKQATAFLYSGVPEELSLDGLPEADWELAMRDHGRRFRMAYYESVRGCPYRCNFCNYPYLFDDTKFRVKSAQRIAADWERLAGLGVEHVTCLDSLFTMPRPRLRELCRLLLARRVRIRWTCYARADDLADEETAALMREAGAQQVQIGIESGDPALLDAMDKACTIEANARALANCRKHGLTSIVSLIVGFPGETPESLERTYRFLAATPPDFYFLATFSTRVAGVPLLRPENRERFGLRVRDGLRSFRTMAPYWEHATMSCAEVSRHVRALDRRLMRDRIALNAAVFYPALIAYAPEHRRPLLELQHRAATRHPVLTGAFDLVHAWIGRRLRRAVSRHFAAPLPVAAR